MTTLVRKRLTPVENERMRAIVDELLDRYTQLQLGEMVGAGQSTLSNFLQKRRGMSVGVAERIAQVAGKSLDDLLCLPDSNDRFPNRAAAVEFARNHPESYSAQAIDFVRNMEREGEDLPVRRWMQMIDFWSDQIFVGNFPPPPSP